ncbi:MAG TPA: FAD-binding oxidoreductase [Acidobacteriota bacterium]|nr:FAD-binding oxidoreductase [Acidobacteriota bacterium]
MISKDELEKIVGKENVSDKERDLLKYSSDHSLVPPGRPDYVVWPSNSEQISKILKLSNEKNVPVVPVSSKEHFNGGAIPKQGGVVVDLTNMNRILEIDKDLKKVRIEAGVTWGQLTGALAKEDMRVIMPLLPHADRSVLTDFLEREVPTNTVYDYGEPMQAFEVVWPTGDIFKLGSASVEGYPDSWSQGGNPSGPGIDFYRFVQGAQGTMGILTWTNLKIAHATKMDKVFFAPVDDLAYAQEFLYRLLPRRVGQEVVLLNRVDLAAIIAENFPADFEKLRATLPPWTLVIVISGLVRRPEEKIAYEVQALKEIVKNEFRKLAVDEALPGFPGLGGLMLSHLRNPWPADMPYWKNRWQGASQSLFFIARPEKSHRFVEIVETIAPKHGYPVADIGSYIQPIEHNRGCQVEFTFFYDGGSAAEKARIAALYKDAARALMNEGALFTRPYGDLAPMVYERAAGYVTGLRRVKKIFDPNNIMNPGTLCF